MGNAPEKSSVDLRAIIANYWPVLVAAVLFIAVQLPALRSWIEVWDEKDGYYSHGYLVPAIAAFMLWTQRGRLRSAELRPSWWGLALLLVFLPVHFVGLVMGLRAVYGLAFFLCIFGAMLLFFGKQITRVALVPIVFLVTMIPVAPWLLDAQTARFQLISTTVATRILQLTTSCDVSQVGNTIVSPNLPGAGTLLIATQCSGLRLLISLITFSWFFTYVIRAASWKKAILIAMSLPLSVFVNSLRITMIAYVGFLSGSEAAMHEFHDYSGYIGLVVCFAILFGVARLLKATDLYTGESVSESEVASRKWPVPVGGGDRGSIVIGLLVGAAAISLLATPVYDLSKGRLDRQSLPGSFGEWAAEDMPIDKTTRDVLSMGDLMSRQYTDNGNTGRRVQVFLDAALDISAFHDPHLCLPGGGSPVSADEIITLKFDKPRPITVKATMLKATSDYGEAILIYWYMLGDRSYPTTNDVFNANRYFKSEDLKRLCAKPWDTGEMRADIHKRQYTWYRFATEAYGDDTDRAFLEAFIKDYIANVKNFGE